MSNLQERLSPSTTLVREIESLSTDGASWRPPVETVRTRRGLTLCFDLPGVVAANVHVSCDESRLRVWGYRPAVACAADLERTSSRPHGAFAIEMPLIEGLDPQRVFRELKDGVLTVYLPRRRESLHRDHAA